MKNLGNFKIAFYTWTALDLSYLPFIELRQNQ